MGTGQRVQEHSPAVLCLGLECPLEEQGEEVVEVGGVLSLAKGAVGESGVSPGNWEPGCPLEGTILTSPGSQT